MIKLFIAFLFLVVCASTDNSKPQPVGQFAKADPSNGAGRFLYAQRMAYEGMRKNIKSMSAADVKYCTQMKEQSEKIYNERMQNVKK